ncbi:MAG: (E)-4-hydroxy-3-methylbut-2-enyl-diphosphate synthase [Bacteroidota bacterium]
MISPNYCIDLLQRKRLPTIEVRIGNLGVGASNPIRLQSMTTTDTMDTMGSVEQSIRMIEEGCEIVRLTAPSKKEAENLAQIRQILLERGFNAPLVADIHFTPNAAEIAAKIVEKVRVNPGNYADKKKFEEIDYTDDSYEKELARIEQKFTPLVLICKEHNTAMRIGTNHGSLSDRILSRYGDTPEGMVESAFEFIRICEKNNFSEIVISMKASNTLVMVQAYRLLVAKMLENGTCYPLHLGVTEAGDGEDGRIKSAVGIGALLEDGIGDTVRVSLTEEPEFEIPVARKLVEMFEEKTNNKTITIPEDFVLPYSPFSHERRETNAVQNCGGKNVPVVVADLSQKDKISPANFFGFGYTYSNTLDKWHLQDLAADYVYIGANHIDFEVPGTLGVICEPNNYLAKYQNKQGFFPLLKEEDLDNSALTEGSFFIQLADDFTNFKELLEHPQAIIVFGTNYDNKTQLFRLFRFNLAKYGIKNPVVLFNSTQEVDAENYQLSVSSQLGTQLIDGFGDGIWLTSNQAPTFVNSTAFGILQATRTRISKTEYISCPSCGRTLFDLQETTNKIRSKTSHLKGIKIGIMGCIVNGPGEMADADYGYVGSGIGVINLYKEKTVVKKNVPTEQAVDELISLIKDHGDWVEIKSEQ